MAKIVLKIIEDGGEFNIPISEIHKLHEFNCNSEEAIPQMEFIKGGGFCITIPSKTKKSFVNFLSNLATKQKKNIKAK